LTQVIFICALGSLAVRTHIPMPSKREQGM